MIRPSVSLWCPCRAPCSSEDRRPCSHLAPPPAASPAPSRSCRHSPGQSLTEPGRASQSLTEPGRNESGRSGRFSGPLMFWWSRWGRAESCCCWRFYLKDPSLSPSCPLSGPRQLTSHQPMGFIGHWTRDQSGSSDAAQKRWRRRRVNDDDEEEGEGGCLLTWRNAPDSPNDWESALPLLSLSTLLLLLLWCLRGAVWSEARTSRKFKQEVWNFTSQNVFSHTSDAKSLLLNREYLSMMSVLYSLHRTSSLFYWDISWKFNQCL